MQGLERGEPEVDAQWQASDKFAHNVLVSAQVSSRAGFALLVFDAVRDNKAKRRAWKTFKPPALLPLVVDGGGGSSPRAEEGMLRDGAERATRAWGPYKRSDTAPDGPLPRRRSDRTQKTRVTEVAPCAQAYEPKSTT